MTNTGNKDLLQRRTSNTSKNNTNIISTSAQTKRAGMTLFDEGWNIALLLLLYTLQGIPMGLSASLPVILKENGATYSDLSLFTMVSMPFSLKLFWAPIVDSVYFQSIGRRKTWLIPSQIITGIVMILGSVYVNNWINHGHQAGGGNEPINIASLTMYFTGLYFLMATQDIAVDGWALTILSRENVTYASICNTIGQSLGVFIANQSYIALSDPVWCQKYLGAAGALVSLSDFMIFWGWVFIVTTVIVCVLKKETSSEDDRGKKEQSTSPSEENTENHPSGAVEPDGLIETCKQTLSVLKIRSVQLLCLMLVTIKVAFAATDSVFPFRLQEEGISKSDIAAMSTVLVFIGFLVPALLSKQLATKPLEIMMYSFMAKLATSILRWMVIYSLHSGLVDSKNLSTSFYAALMVVLIVHDAVSTSMFLGFMSFFARIADPSIGGTYMTLLNTVANLGALWPRPLALWLLPQLSTHVCYDLNQSIVSVQAEGDQFCGACTELGGHCKLVSDGFTTETFLFFGIGVFWIIIAKGSLLAMQSKPHSEWMTQNKIVPAGQTSSKDRNS